MPYMKGMHKRWGLFDKIFGHKHSVTKGNLKESKRGKLLLFEISAIINMHNNNNCWMV